MKMRISIFSAIILFGVITALGLSAILAVSTYSNSQLRVGGPLYSQIKLGNDLLADILPPPVYVVEAYLEATLALQEPSKASAHKERLAQLHKEFEDRQEFWIKSDLDPVLKSDLTVKSHAEVQRFWTTAERELLPALISGDRPAAEKSYARLTSAYTAHRAIIDDIIKKANADNAELEATAAKRITLFSLLVWSVSGAVVLIIVFGIAGIAIGVIRPVVRMTSAVTQMAAGDLGIVIPG